METTLRPSNDTGHEEDILSVINNMRKKQKEEDEEFLNNKYFSLRNQSTNYPFNEDSKFSSLTFINNNLALEQYIKDQRCRQKNIENGKLKVNYNEEFKYQYTPGKRNINYPTTSCLTRNQMTAAYYQLVKFKTLDKSFDSQIRDEKEEFQSYVQQMWRNTNYRRAVGINPSVESIIDNYWQSKISEAKSVHPSVYCNVSTVPMTLNEEESNQVYLQHMKDLNTLGSYHLIRDNINVKQEYHLTTDSKELTSWLQYEQQTETSFETQLDADQTAESLAITNNCQVVMTTSSVKTLLNNHSENHFATSWMLPVEIRMVIDPTTGQEKKVIFINKKLTHKTMTNIQKLYWFAKLAAKKFCFDYSNQEKDEETLSKTARKSMKKRARAIEKLAMENSSTNCNDDLVEIARKKSEMILRTAETAEQSQTKVECDINCTKQEHSETLHKEEEVIEQNDEFKPSVKTSPSKVESPSRTRNSPVNTESVNVSNMNEESDDYDSDENGCLTIDVPDLSYPSHMPSEESQSEEPNPQSILIEESATTNTIHCDRRVHSTDSKSEDLISPQNTNVQDPSQPNVDPKESQTSPSDPKIKSRSPGLKFTNRPFKPLEPIVYSELTSHGRNKKYSLWKLFKEYTPGSELLKNVHHPLNILLRSKQDAKNKYREERYLCIRPKVEYQPEFGAEVTSLHELLDEWASLYLRPSTDLLRVRVAYDNLEVIMSELRYVSELSHLIQNQYKLNPRHTVGNLYSVLWYLMELLPGRYLLSHEPKSNAFVNVYRAEPKGSYLPMAGWQSSEGIARAPWRPIDPTIFTPTHHSTRTVPCLFTPSTAVVAIKRNAKKQKHINYQNHIADLKKQHKAEVKQQKQKKKKKNKKSQNKKTETPARETGDSKVSKTRGNSLIHTPYHESTN